MASTKLFLVHRNLARFCELQTQLDAFTKGVLLWFCLQLSLHVRIKVPLHGGTTSQILSVLICKCCKQQPQVMKAFSNHRKKEKIRRRAVSRHVPPCVHPVCISTGLIVLFFQNLFRAISGLPVSFPSILPTSFLCSQEVY